jgi:hypothetical protein
MTICAPSCWSGGGCGAAATVSIPASSISPATAVSARGCARRIGRKPRASRAVHRVPAAQLLPAAGRPAGAGGSDRRPRDSVAVGRWLREVANVRAHGTIGEIRRRLVIERVQLKPVPTHFPGPTYHWCRYLAVRQSSETQAQPAIGARNVVLAQGSMRAVPVDPRSWVVYHQTRANRHRTTDPLIRRANAAANADQNCTSATPASKWLTRSISPNASCGLLPRSGRKIRLPSTASPAARRRSSRSGRRSTLPLGPQ